MSVKIMSKIFDSKGLTANQKIVLLSLADHGNDDGLSIYPSIKKTSERTGLSERSIIRVQKELEEIGLLIINQGGGRKSNHYEININKLNKYSNNENNQNVIHDTVSPVTACHPTPDTVSPQGCHSVTPGVSQCHPTPDTVSPESLINHEINQDLNSSIIMEKNTDNKILFNPYPNPKILPLWVAITGMFDIPGNEKEKVLPAFDILYNQYKTDDEFISEGKKYYNEWCKRRGKDGRYYKKLNCSWFYDWWVSGEIPEKSLETQKLEKPKRTEEEIIDDYNKWCEENGQPENKIEYKSKIPS